MNLLNVNQAAEFLSVSASTMRRLYQNGLLDHYRVGQGRGQVRFSEEQLKAYLEGNACVVVAHESRRKTPTPRRLPRAKTHFSRSDIRALVAAASK